MPLNCAGNWGGNCPETFCVNSDLLSDSKLDHHVLPALPLELVLLGLLVLTLVTTPSSDIVCILC